MGMSLGWEWDMKEMGMEMGTEWGWNETGMGMGWGGMGIE